jgi:hypothetical protein
MEGQSMTAEKVPWTPFIMTKKFKKSMFADGCDPVADHLSGLLLFYINS